MEKIESLPAVNNVSLYDRPVRTPAAQPKTKREYSDTPATASPQAPTTKNDDQHPASAYKPLGKFEFRLLHLAPGGQNEDIVLWFETANMRRPPKYEAISYLYGGRAKQTPVTIKLKDSSHGKSHPILIRSNLYNALRSLRHPIEEKAYWADALCINHSDLDERSAQVEKKRDIFHNAENVCFWVGDNANDRKALDFIPKIIELTEIDKLVRSEEAIDDWIAFVGLLGNEVFSRLWFVQELAVARNVTLHCGLKSKHYGDLVDAVSIFVSYRDSIAIRFCRNGKDHKILADRKMTMAERFINVSTNALRILSDGSIQRLLSLEALVSMLCDFSATDHRDRIYSVWGIAKDGLPLVNKTLMEHHEGSPGDGRINYNTALEMVYLNFARDAITSSKSLDIICRHWASSVPDSAASLPTWIRPFQSYQPPSENSLSERTSADSLVGLPDHSLYNASKGKTATFRFENDVSLFARGIRIDTISKLGFRASEGIIFKEWLKLGGCPIEPEGELPPEDFWRTLVADRGSNSFNPPSWYSRVFDYCHHRLTAAGDLNTHKVMKESEPTDENKDGSFLVVKFLQRVQSVIWNRRFLVTRDNEWKGLAPSAAEVGDHICILYGCSVPVVLRPTVGTDERVTYQLIGECYVHGMMDGEAVEGVVDDENDRRVKDFELR
jgi:hypothetical protein